MLFNEYRPIWPQTTNCRLIHTVDYTNPWKETIRKLFITNLFDTRKLWAVISYLGDRQHNRYMYHACKAPDCYFHNTYCQIVIRLHRISRHVVKSLNPLYLFCNNDCHYNIRMDVLMGMVQPELKLLLYQYFLQDRMFALLGLFT